MNNKKSISAIIPNYNGKHLLQQYLPTTIDVLKQCGAHFEIIIIDDASTDGSVDYLKSEFKDVKVIINTENKGFSYTCNRGIEIAACRLIFLLNSDVKLTPGYFDNQWKYFDYDDTFGVMGRIINMHDDGIQDAARAPQFNGFKLKTAYFYYPQNLNNKAYTLYLSGANALIDAVKLKSMGGFYELFSPFYCEDMELSVRAWRLNWKCYYEHNAVCRHHLSATTSTLHKPKWVKVIYHRNRYFFHALHLQGLALFIWFLQISFELFFKLLGGHFWLIKSYIKLIKNEKAIAVYRKKNKKLFANNNIKISVFDVVKTIKKNIQNLKKHTF